MKFELGQFIRAFIFIVVACAVHVHIWWTGFDYIILVSGFRPLFNPCPRLSRISFVGNFLHNISEAPVRGVNVCQLGFRFTRDTRYLPACVHTRVDRLRESWDPQGVWFLATLCARQRYIQLRASSFAKSRRNDSCNADLLRIRPRGAPVAKVETSLKDFLPNLHVRMRDVNLIWEFCEEEFWQNRLYSRNGLFGRSDLSICYRVCY